MKIQSMPCYWKMSPYIKEEKLSTEKKGKNSPLEPVASCMRPQETNKMAHIKTLTIVKGNDGWTS